jgi:secreted trypsin-like serine protease
LTAAHCADSSPTSILVSVGDHNLTAPDGETFFQVTNITIHPLWNTNAITYDYAILTLNTPVVISPNTPFVGLVCLPPDVTQTFAGASLTSSGWGYTVGGVSASASSVLKAAYLRGMSDMDCSAAMVL